MRSQRYSLRCSACGCRSDDVTLLYCPECGAEALLRSEYRLPLVLNGAPDSFLSYAAWLPVEQPLSSECPRFACFQNVALAQQMGIDDLWILLSGQAPAVGAESRTGSFKETEAIGILSRVREQSDRTLILASAGNAARAVLELGARQGCRAVVVVPDSGEPLLRFHHELKAGGPLLIIVENAFYMDAIRFVEKAASAFPDALVREGGCHNVARRDAMGVPFLRATIAMGGLPDRYVQAVGSGTGAIAAWEASMRLLAHGQVAPRKMRLHLMQNVPFTPMVEAWQSRSRTLPKRTDAELREQLSSTYASVLSNASPPYAVRGGVFDTLSESDGDMDGVTNDEARAAQEQVARVLGFRPCAAASVAAAGVIRGRRNGKIAPHERVLLHLTGTEPDDSAKLLDARDYPHRVAVSSVDEGLAAIRDYLAAPDPRTGHRILI